MTKLVIFNLVVVMTEEKHLNQSIIPSFLIHASLFHNNKTVALMSDYTTTVTNVNEHSCPVMNEASLC